MKPGQGTTASEPTAPVIVNDSGIIKPASPLPKHSSRLYWFGLKTGHAPAFPSGSKSACEPNQALTSLCCIQPATGTFIHVGNIPVMPREG